MKILDSLMSYMSFNDDLTEAEKQVFIPCVQRFKETHQASFPNYALYDLTIKHFGNVILEKVLDLCPNGKLVSKSDIEADHDMALGDIRIEVKGSRLVRKGRETFADRAVEHGTKSEGLSFLQIHPKYFDVFVGVGVWKDTFRYWAIPQYVMVEISNPQHRDSDTRCVRIPHSRLHKYNQYLAEPDYLEDKIQEAFEDQQKFNDEARTSIRQSQLQARA